MEHLDAIKIVRDIIKGGKRHRHYDRTVDKAKEYKAFITGEGIDDFMVKFPRRETTEEFNQRKDLTINITETVCGNLIDPQEKVSRSNSIERTYLFVDNEKKKKDDFDSVLSSFYDGGKSVDDYMSDMWIKLNALDPNTFVAIDWKTNTEGERIKPYPVEYPSESVYHFSKTNATLNWVVVHRDETDYDPEMYILYAPNFTVLFTSRTPFEKWPHEADIAFYKEFPVNDFNGPVAVFMQEKDTYWDITIPQPHNTGWVPGFFVGYVRDLYTGGSYLSSIYKAMPILKKILKANSELDITMASHAFQQKVQLVDPCPHCNQGVKIDGTVCDSCDGTGFGPKQVHKSALDIMQIPRPRDKEDMPDLSKMIYYVPQDVRLLKFQDEYVDKLTRKCKEAVYNSEVFSRKDVAETAYGKNVDLQNVYDALWSMAKAYSFTQNFIVKTLARITALEQGLVYRISFRKDFKMKSLTDLYNDLSIVGTASADEFVKQAIQDDIAQILYEDDPRELLKYNTKQYFFPFNGKTRKEIEIIVTNPQMVNEKIRTLWSNFSWIFDEIEQEFKQKKIDFYQLTRDKQRIAIEKKVEEIIKTLPKNEIDVGEHLSGIEKAAGNPAGRPVETP
jgi:hypothetical protein